MSELDKMYNERLDSYETYLEEMETDYSRIMPEVYFIGEIPFLTIIQNITEQFDDYINTEDHMNYVSVFYQQLDDSYKVLNDDSVEYPDEIKNSLDIINSKFIDHILNLFESRLFININDIEDVSAEDLSFIIQRSYEYFILNAKTNFKSVISSSINGMIPADVSDDEYFTQLQSLMELFSPLITTITPVEFLQLTGDVEIYNLFVNGRIVGNFLRKYTPKLYQNEIYAMEVVNYSTMVRLFKNELETTSSQESLLK